MAAECQLSNSGMCILKFLTLQLLDAWQWQYTIIKITFMLIKTDKPNISHWVNFVFKYVPFSFNKDLCTLELKSCYSLILFNVPDSCITSKCNSITIFEVCKNDLHHLVTQTVHLYMKSIMCDPPPTCIKLLHKVKLESDEESAPHI
jgi:hypothetical protein